jgi:hypothetical protein
MLHAILFVTGGAVLALELLASRVMTPYFGVSLYIWTGILSITLVALALGYWAGGLLAAGRPRRTLSPDALTRLFFTMPAAASPRWLPRVSRIRTSFRGSPGTISSAARSSPASCCCSCRWSPPRR